jgi:hypothetical protein
MVLGCVVAGVGVADAGRGEVSGSFVSGVLTADAGAGSGLGELVVGSDTCFIGYGVVAAVHPNAKSAKIKELSNRTEVPFIFNFILLECTY